MVSNVAGLQKLLKGDLGRVKKKLPATTLTNLAMEIGNRFIFGNFFFNAIW